MTSDAIDDPPGYRNYWSVEHMTEFPDAAVDVFCRRADNMVVPSPSQHIMFPWGGAVAPGEAITGESAEALAVMAALSVDIGYFPSLIA